MDKNKPLFKVIIFVIVIVVMVLFVKSYLSDGKEYSADSAAQHSGAYSNSANADCIVDISGEVNNPGVYNIEPGMIVDQAVMVAGGYTDKADVEAINRAEKVYDGMKIVVPNLDDSYMDIYRDILDN